MAKEAAERQKAEAEAAAVQEAALKEANKRDAEQKRRDAEVILNMMQGPLDNTPCPLHRAYHRPPLPSHQSYR